MIFLVNDESINHYYYYYDNCIDDLELFNRIKNKFDNEIIVSFININDRLTYKSFLDSFNSICLESKSFPSEIINNLNCINIMCNMSSLYISIKQSPSSQPSIIDSIIRQRYEKLDNNFDLLNEIENYSLQFDIQFKKESGLVAKKIGKEKCRLFSSELKIELGNVNYIIQNRFYWNRQELEGIQRDHISFLEEEFLNIIKILCGDKDCGFFYEENIEILNQQIENDKLRFQELFSPYMKLIETKENPKEEDFLDAKNKGTSYILKEKENVTEVKVAIEMDTDLKSIIKQDF